MFSLAPNGALREFVDWGNTGVRRRQIKLWQSGSIPCFDQSGHNGDLRRAGRMAIWRCGKLRRPRSSRGARTAPACAPLQILGPKTPTRGRHRFCRWRGSLFYRLETPKSAESVPGWTEASSPPPTSARRSAISRLPKVLGPRFNPLNSKQTPLSILGRLRLMPSLEQVTCKETTVTSRISAISFRLFPLPTRFFYLLKPFRRKLH
jgi:hypothetical protein